MNKHFALAAFAAGLAVVGWVGMAYVGSGLLALAMTLLIAAFYVMGGVELRAFHQATLRLQAALAELPGATPARLGDWLQTLPPALRHPVRLRIEGERVGLPGPALTPYLVGLLVLLGMLGTFLGMVVTLNGAVLALETTTDLPTIRAALAAPVKGLGLAFGTSVAGVAASAMLGLVSALCRRERLLAGQVLDTRIATDLHVHTAAHQRQATLAALQLQARVMPEVVGQMQALLAQLERRSDDLDAGLQARQERFHGEARAAYAGLAASVDRSLKDSLTESARVAGAALQPVAQATMAGIARETAAFQARLAEGHAQQAAALLAEVAAADAARRADGAAADSQRLAAWTQSLQAMAAALQGEWQQAGSQALARQAQICQTLEDTAQALQAQAATQARDTIAAVSRLVETASEAPRAAAELVGRLREQLSESLARDNVLLDERQRIMATLDTLLDTVNQAAGAQRDAIDALVQSSAALLQQTGAQFGAKVDAEATKLTAAATQLTGSAVEVASLGEAFGAAVQLFSESSEAMTLQLQRIEGALGKSTARSDEQLAYYVAQAREIIDLSLAAQKQIVDDLQQLAANRQPLAGEPA